MHKYLALVKLFAWPLTFVAVLFDQLRQRRALVQLVGHEPAQRRIMACDSSLLLLAHGCSPRPATVHTLTPGSLGFS